MITLIHTLLEVRVYNHFVAADFANKPVKGRTLWAGYWLFKAWSFISSFLFRYFARKWKGELKK